MREREREREWVSECTREREREREHERERVRACARESRTHTLPHFARCAVGENFSEENFSALQLFSNVDFAMRRLLRNFYPGHNFSKVSPTVLVHSTFCSAPIFEKCYRTRRHSLPLPTRGALGRNFSKVSSLPTVLCKKTTGLTFEKLYPYCSACSF